MTRAIATLIFLSFLLLLSPGLRAQQASLFTVYGEVFLSDSVTFAPDSFVVSVANVTTAETLVTNPGLSEEGKYSVLFIDFANNRAAAVGDVIDVIVYDHLDQIVGVHSSYVLTTDDIEDKGTRLDVVTSVDPVIGIGERVAAGRSIPLLLLKIFPNPFNPHLYISYRVVNANLVDVSIYDVEGRLLKNLVRRYQEPSEYEIKWDGIDNKGIRVSSGVYFIKILCGNHTVTNRVVLIK